MLETLALVAALMLSPGPANLTTLALAGRHGAAATRAFRTGVVLGYALVAAVVGLAGQSALERADGLRGVIALLGGAYVAWLGVGLARRREDADTPASAPTLRSGLTLQLLNPKYPVVVLTLLASDAATPPAARLATLVAAGALGLAVYAGAGAYVGRLVASPDARRTLDRVFAALLVATGAWLALSPWLRGSG